MHQMKHIKINKALALLLAVILLLISALGGTLAYVVVRTPSLRNTFTYTPLKDNQVFIDITKHMEGKSYPLSGFTFELLDENGTSVAVSDPTDANGKTCLKLTYDPWAAGKTYRYTLREVNSGIPGMSYDQAVRTLAVTVTKDRADTVYANFIDPAETEPTPTETEPVPTETVTTPTEPKTTPTETSPVPTEADLTPTETNPIPTETDLTPTETNPIPTETAPTPVETNPVPTETAPTPAETNPVPTETAPTSTETAPTPTETEPTEPEPKSLGKTLEVSFTNTYEPKHIHGLKTLDGALPNDHEFTFALYESDSTFAISGQPIQTVTNDEQGVFDFDPIDYPGPGTYYYAVVEDSSNGLTNIVYDSTVFGVEIQVAADGGITMTVFENGEETELILFENETVFVPPTTEPTPTDPIPTTPPETTPPTETIPGSTETQPTETQPTETQPPAATVATEAPTEAPAEETTRPTTPGTTSSTGDDSHAEWYAFAMFTSLAAILVLLLLIRRRSKGGRYLR